MTHDEHATPAGRPLRGLSPGRVVTCAVMVLAAAGLVVAVFLGAPLVSILLVGLLLLCPLLMWVPYRYERDAQERDRFERGARLG